MTTQFSRIPLKRILLIVILMGFLSLSLTPLRATYAHVDKTIPNPLVQSMLEQVDPNRIYTLTGDLSGEWPVMIGSEPYTIVTRYAFSGEPINNAAHYLNQYYQDLGLDASLQEFTWSNHLLSNVVAEIPGTIFPGRVYLITSHYDNLPSTPPAPGADDNASGAVAVMAAADILSQYEFGCTLRFVNFTAEEHGLVGSDYYAHQAYCAGEDIRGVLNLDMIGWNTLGSSPEMDLYAHPNVSGSSQIADLFHEVVANYGLNLIPTYGSPLISASDHASFWRYGFPAILAIEDLNDFNPYYHTQLDRLANLPDLDYYTEMVKASLGTFAHMGCLVETRWGTLTGQVIDTSTHSPIIGAIVSINNPQWGYTFTTTTDNQGNYAISALDGWHDLSVDGIGYVLSTFTEVYITPDQTLTLNLELEPTNEVAIYLPLTANAMPILPGCP
jgi:hypothetical protein